MIYRKSLAAAVVVAVVVCAPACTSQDDASPQPTADTQSDSVQVERRSLTSTLVLTGTVVPSPEYLVESMVPGQISFESGLAPGATVAAGHAVARVGGEAVVTPAGGVITEILTPDGAKVVPRIPVAIVAYEGFGVVVEVPVSEQYRLYEGAITALVNITGGPSGLECQLVPPREALEVTESVAVLCLLPLNAAVTSGLETKVGLNTGSAADVLTLPLQAVSGRAAQGKVSRLNPDGTHEVVTVELGLTDGVHIEIVSGLELGDTVAAFPPGVG